MFTKLYSPRIFSFLLLCLLASFSGVYAQTKRLGFKQLTTDDGLSSSSVSCVLQDYKGFIWVGTAVGLNRYDGFKFVVYKGSPEDPESFSDNVIQTIFEDHNKDLLIGTENGLFRYDRGKDKFDNLINDKASPFEGLEGGFSMILEDEKNNLWLATSIGLIYFDRQKNEIIRYTHNADHPESLSNDNLVSILFDDYKRLWVSTRKGLNVLLPGSGTFWHFNNIGDSKKDLTNTIFRKSVKDAEGNLWFGSSDGLYCVKNNIELEKVKILQYQHDSKNASSLSINQVSSLFVDKQDNIWVGTENGGLNVFDKKNQVFHHYFRDEYYPMSLNNESIESIFQDKAGNMWLGTFSGGLNIAMKNNDAIIKYQNLPGAPFSLSNNTVTAFLEDHSGNIFVATDGGGLNLFDETINRFKRFQRENSSISSNSVLCITEDSRNQIWLGTWAGGVVHYNPKTGSFTALTTKNSKLTDDNIYAVAEGYDNDLWLGTFEHGLIHYQLRENKFTNFTPQNSKLGNEMIVKIVKFPKGKFLIGSTENLQLFDPLTNQFTTYSSLQDNKNSLSYPRVTDILVCNDTTVWIGTPNGLNRFNPATGNFKRFFEKDGLPDNFINGLILDEYGYLWVTTNKGACRFLPRTQEFKSFIKADGLQGNEFSERSIMKSKDGSIFMGGTRGFNIIHPEKISENNKIPDILITDLKIFNKSIKPGGADSPLTNNITDTKELVLSHKQAVLTFSFAVMDFSIPEKNQYAYMMENFDTDWTFPGNKGEATYTNLSPGTYIFRVKGSNNDGLWNETGTSIRITVLPPWWNTLLFKILFCLLIILIFTAFYLYRIRNLKRQKILLEKTVESKTAELKELNASKDKFFSIIAHDLKNPFSSIVGLSEVLDDDKNLEPGGKARQIAHMIHASSIQTFRLLENLLEWAATQRGTISYRPASINLNELVREELNILSDMANGKKISLNNTLADDFYIYGDRNMIKTIIRNLLSNAIKFTPVNGSVEISAKQSHDMTEVTVKDSGIGMSEVIMGKLFRLDANLSTRGTADERGTGLGLLLCREFVEKHKGKIWAESKPGIGSTFRFVIPSAGI